MPGNVIKEARPAPNLFLMNKLIFCLIALRAAFCATQTRLVERVLVADVDRMLTVC